MAFLKQRIFQRGESLRQQLGAPGKAIKFDATKVVQLSDWKQKIDLGNPLFSQVAGQDGKTALDIRGADGPCAGSWRTRALLETGAYRFEAVLKTEGVMINPADAREGVCIRISRGKPPRKLYGSTDWIRVFYDFEVLDPVQDVELVCELRAAAGEAWFDAKSLRLIRK